MAMSAGPRSLGVPRLARRSLAAIAVAAVTLTLLAPAAAAHASLVSTSPAQDAVVAVAPSEVVLTFSETVSGGGSALRVFDPSGTQLAGLKDRFVDNRLSTKLPPLTAKGSYTVAWNVVSADGHPVGGTFLFHYQTKTLTKPLIALTGNSTPFGAAVLRVLGALALFASLTAIAGPWWFGRRRVADRRLWSVAIAGGLLLLGGGVWVAGSLAVFTSTATGVAVLVVVGLTVLGVIVAPTRAGPPLATVALIAAALPGHAVSLAPVPLSATFTAIHVLCAAAWITNLVQLDRVARRDDASTLRAEIFRRSPVLMGSVAVLAGTGLWLAIDRVGFTTLLDTTYGKLAAVKLGLLVGALALAVYHRFVLAPRLTAAGAARPVAVSADVAPEPTLERFRVTLRAEIVVVAMAVVVATFLGQFSPVAAGHVQGGPYDQRIEAGSGLKAELSVYPGTRGRNDLHFYLFDANGDQATDVHNLVVQLSHKAKDVNDIEPKLVVVTESHVIAQNVQIPFSGIWTVELTGSKGQFEPIDATWQVPIGD
jgi:copper transport protein